MREGRRGKREEKERGEIEKEREEKERRREKRNREGERGERERGKLHSWLSSGGLHSERHLHDKRAARSREASAEEELVSVAIFGDPSEYFPFSSNGTKEASKCAANGLWVV